MSLREQQEDMVWYSKYTNLGPDRFVWGKYAGKVGIATHIEFDHMDKVFPSHPKREIVGYCEGSQLIVRPRPDSVALLVWDPELGEEFWFHVYKEE